MNNASMVVQPAGNCEATETVRSFTKDGKKIALTCRTEERSYGETVIVEKERTRVSTSDSCISIVRVNTALEDGASTRMIECASIRNKGEETRIWRRQKLLKGKRIIRDCEMCETEGREFFVRFHDETFRKYSLSENRK